MHAAAVLSWAGLVLGAIALVIVVLNAVTRDGRRADETVKLLEAVTAASKGSEDDELRLEIRRLRDSVIHLTDAVDQIIPLLTGELSMTRRDQLERLVRMNTAAKLAMT